MRVLVIVGAFVLAMFAYHESSRASFVTPAEAGPQDFCYGYAICQ